MMGKRVLARRLAGHPENDRVGTTAVLGRISGARHVALFRVVCYAGAIVHLVGAVALARLFQRRQRRPKAAESSCGVSGPLTYSRPAYL